MKLLRRLLAGASSVAFGLGLSGANAAIQPTDQANQNASPGYQIEITDQDLATLLLDQVPPKPVKGVQVAARFKEKGEKGRPDLFGDPGVPDIGAPGQSGY